MLKRFRIEQGSDNDVVIVPVDVIRRATEAIFRICGMTPSSATTCADVLIANDLRGNDSHGVSNMLRKYTEWFLTGAQNPRPYVKIVRNGRDIESDNNAVSIIDGDGGLGLHVGPMAMRLAIQKAKKFGVGCVIVKNAGHLGGAGYHTSLAAKDGCIGQCFGAPGGGLMCPTFGAEPRFGTHPMSWAAPGGKTEADFLFDVATTQVAGNKIRLAARLGVRLASNWITDEEGKVIEEELENIPEKFYMTPMGGTRENSSHKGYGLACVIDIMCNTLSGIGAGFLTGGGGLFFQAYDIKSFCEIEEYEEWIDKFLYGLKTTPAVPECKEESDRVLYPGLYAHEVSQDRSKNGIPYHKEVLFWYTEFAKQMKTHSYVQKEGTEEHVNYLISLTESEFPSYEVNPEEKIKWGTLLSGVLGQSSMSHGTLKDQSVGKWRRDKKCDRNKMVLLDGSMGRHLCLNGLPHEEGTLFRKIWSAAALAEPKYHDLIIKAHVDYIESGSQIITTNSYATQPKYYAEAYGEDKYEELMLAHAKLSAELANIARRRSPLNNDIKVYGVLPPICESHQPGLFKDFALLKGQDYCKRIYEELSKALYEGGVDGFLLESLNCWEEAYFALEGVKAMKKKIGGKSTCMPVIVSMEGALRDNERQPSPDELGPKYVDQFLKYFDANPNLNITAFGLNCAEPEDMLNSFECIFKDRSLEQSEHQEPCYESITEEFQSRNIGICAYCNLNDRRKVHSEGFDRSKDKSQSIRMRSDLVDNKHSGYCKFIEEFVKRFHVNYIGGCCGCGPQGIKRLQEIFL